MIGVTLRLGFLKDGDVLQEGQDGLLEKLKNSGVRSIELYTVLATHSPDELLDVAKKLWARGFRISIHGKVASRQTAVSDVFLPLQKILSSLGQDELNVTIHPIDGDNVGVLNDLADYVENNNLPVTIALENNRLLPNKSEGDSVGLVLDAVTKANRNCVGICFDFGHYLYYRLKNLPMQPFELPSKEFLRRVIHTHIHALNGFKTHFPLGEYNMPLKDIFEKLSHNYFGIYNIELNFTRVMDVGFDVEKALLCSVDALKQALPFVAELYDDVRDNFDDRFLSAIKELDGSDKTKFSLVHSAAYLFNTNGYRWGMDLAFRNAKKLATTPNRCAELLKDLDLMVITHGHGDHFEQSTVQALAKNNIKWVMPDFLLDTAIEYGIPLENILVAKDNQPISIANLTLLPFTGRHFRPNSTKGVNEYGYLVTAKNAPSIVFPADVRDFSLENLKNIQADYCFAHVWLGDKQGLGDDYEPLASMFAEFMTKFSTKNILLTHLNETGRGEKEMWREKHALLLKEKIQTVSPEIKVIIPKCGQVIELTSD